jgi:uncharacterized membrane protein YeaQ/YmgE (transglycosylase-associated protein family)
MVVGLVVIFGAVIGLMCFSVRGSGYGLGWDMGLGISGSIMASFVMTAAYVFNLFTKAGAMGLNWYSLAVTVGGACMLVYGALLFKKINKMVRIEKLVLSRRIRPA